MNNPHDTTASTIDEAAATGVEQALDEALDEALKEGFPASDPVAIDIEHPPKAAQVAQ